MPFESSSFGWPTVFSDGRCYRWFVPLLCTLSWTHIFLGQISRIRCAVLLSIYPLAAPFLSLPLAGWYGERVLASAWLSSLSLLRLPRALSAGFLPKINCCVKLRELKKNVNAYGYILKKCIH